MHLQTHLQFIITKFLLFLTLKLRLTLKHTKFSHKNLHTLTNTQLNTLSTYATSCSKSNIYFLYDILWVLLHLHTPYTHLQTYLETLTCLQDDKHTQYIIVYDTLCIIVPILTLCIISCFLCFILRFSIHVFLRM